MFVKDANGPALLPTEITRARFAASLESEWHRLEAKAEKAQAKLNEFVATLTREETNEYVALTQPK